MSVESFAAWLRTVEVSDCGCMRAEDEKVRACGWDVCEDRESLGAAGADTSAVVGSACKCGLVSQCLSK